MFYNLFLGVSTPQYFVPLGTLIVLTYVVTKLLHRVKKVIRFKICPDINLSSDLKFFANSRPSVSIFQKHSSLLLLNIYVFITLSFICSLSWFCFSVIFIALYDCVGRDNSIGFQMSEMVIHRP